MNKLEALAASGADGGQIADAAVTTWRAIDAALSPVIGHRGSAALYRRTLHLARASYPWLARSDEGVVENGDFASLRDSLAQQTGVQAAAAHDSMLQSFHDLLADLVGRSLTKRLLQSVWESTSSGTAAQDASS